MAYNVKFLKGTAAAYASITKDANTFYYTTDDNQFYLGSIKLSNSSDLASAITRIAANESAIGTLQALTAKLDGDAETAGSVRALIAGAISTLEGTLADVATSGAAEDVSVTDNEGNFTSTNVEDALTELVGMIDDGGAGSVVTLSEASTPTTGYLKTYEIYQGGNTSADLVGVIDIPKDLVVTSGQVVVDPQGQTSGTYIELTIANQDEPIYINVADLVDAYTAAQNATQVQLAISNANEISASIVAGSIGTTELGSKVVTAAKIADNTITENQLSSSVNDSLDLADSAVQSVATGTTDGTIAVDGTDISVAGLGSAAYEDTTAFDAAGAADDVLGESTDGADANTVYGAKAAASAAQGTADQAILDAAAAQSDVDALELLVGNTAVSTQISNAIGDLDVTDTAVSGKYVSAVSQSDGEISVTRADLPDYSNTYEAKGTAASLIEALDVTDTAESGKYVSAVSQTNGEISVTRASLPDYSLTYDAYGAAATAESNANSYTDAALTWGTFTAAASSESE